MGRQVVVWWSIFQVVKVRWRPRLSGRESLLALMVPHFFRRWFWKFWFGSIFIDLSNAQCKWTVQLYFGILWFTSLSCAMILIKNGSCVGSMVLTCLVTCLSKYVGYFQLLIDLKIPILKRMAHKEIFISYLDNSLNVYLLKSIDNFIVFSCNKYLYDSSFISQISIQF